MFKVTRYCVQVFERERPPDAARQFRDRDEALEAGRLAARRAAGVAIYEVTGEPVQDLWRCPNLIKKYGVVPLAALDQLRLEAVADVPRLLFCGLVEHCPHIAADNG